MRGQKVGWMKMDLQLSQKGKCEEQEKKGRDFCGAILKYLGLYPI